MQLQLEGQLFPSLLDRATIVPTVEGDNIFIALVFLFIFILGILYWLIIVLY